MAVEKVSLKGICREVGVHHLQVTEVLRRIDSAVREDKEVITQEVGTFYLRKSKARTRRLQGTDYQVPARNTVALRGKRFQGRAVIALVFARLLYNDQSTSVYNEIRIDQRIDPDVKSKTETFEFISNHTDDQTVWVLWDAVLTISIDATLEGSTTNVKLEYEITITAKLAERGPDTHPNHRIREEGATEWTDFQLGDSFYYSGVVGGDTGNASPHDLFQWFGTTSGRNGKFLSFGVPVVQIVD